MHRHTAVVRVNLHVSTGGRTPGTALNNNLRTPATGAMQESAGRSVPKALNTVAAASTRPSRFMQAAARPEPSIGHRPSAGHNPSSATHAPASEPHQSSAHNAPPSTGWCCVVQQVWLMCCIGASLGLYNGMLQRVVPTPTF